MSTVLLVCLAVSAAQRPEFPRYETPLAQHVVLTMATDRTTYSVRQPLMLRLTVRNDHSEPVPGYFAIDPDGPLVDIYYRRGAAEFTRLERGRSHGDYIHRPRTIRPGEEISAEGVVVFDHGLDRFLFDQPGIYQLRVVYRDVRGATNATLESAGVSVEVVHPSGEHRQAEELFSRELALVSEFEPAVSSVTSGQIKAAALFLERYPDSPYSPTLRNGVREALRQRLSRHLATSEERELYERFRVQEPSPQ